MSQVRKYAKGGGTITKGGVTYEYTPELAQELSQFLSVNGAQDLYEIVDGFANGDNIKINPNGTIQGVSAWSGDKNLDANVSNWRKNLDAWNNNRYHKIRSQLPILSGWIPNSNKQTTETPTNLTDIFGNRDWFEYNTDENGKKTYLNNSSKNNLLMQRLDNMTEYLSDEEAGKKKYKLGQEYDTQRMAGLRQLFNTNKDKWGTTVDTLKTRIQSGEDLTPEEIAFLENFNIAKGDGTSSGVASTAAVEAATRKRFTDAGYDYDKWSPYIEWNDTLKDWRVSAAGQDALKQQFGQVGNYDFNDAFMNSEYNPYGNFDFLGGHVIIGDRIYKASDAEGNSDLAKWLSRKGGVRELNAAMRLEEANNQMEQFWGKTPQWTRGDSKHYLNWVNPNGNRYYQGVTGSYDWEKTNDKASQLAAFIDIDPTKADAFGRYTPQFMETDINGNALVLDENGNAVAYAGTPTMKANPTKANFYTRELRYSESNPYSEFNGRYLVGDAIDNNGKTTGLGFWINPSNPEDIIVDADLSKYVSGWDNKATRLSPEMARILNKYPAFMQNLQRNPVMRDRFVKWLAARVAGRLNRNVGNTLGRSHGLLGSSWYGGKGEAIDESDWKALGITNSNDVKALQEIANRESEAHDLWKSSGASRQAKWVVTKPTDLYKSGGKIEKHDIGQLLGTADENKSAATQTKLDKPIRDPKKFHQIGTDDPWQAHDTLELGALLGDIASLGISLGAGWNPVGSVAAGITGMAGSTAGFAADVKRDGFQTSDLGNYAINLGLDALSFIPIAGGASKVAKVGRLFTKHAKTVKKAMTAAAAAGLISAGDAAYQKLQRGENLDIRDIRTIANALGGVAHMYRTGIKGLPKRGTGQIELPNIKAKPGKEAATFDLPESTFGKISEAKNSGEVAEIIAKELNKNVAEGGTQWTKESVLDTYDLSDIVKNRKRFLLFGKNKERIADLSAKMKKGKLDWDNREVLGGNKAKQRSADYNAMLEGRQRVKEQSKTERPWNEMMPDREYFRDPYFIDPSKTQTVPNDIDPMIIRNYYRRVPRRTPVTSGFIFSPYADDRMLGWRQYNTERPIEEAIAPEAPAASGYVWKPVVQPMFKKGGKLVKAQPGLNTSLLDKNILDGGFSDRWKAITDKAKVLSDDLEFTKALRENNTPKLNESVSAAASFKVPTPKVEGPMKQNTVTIPGTENWTLSAKSPAKESTVQSSIYDFGNPLGGSPGSVPYLDPTMPANWIGAGVANQFAKNQLNAWMKRYRGNPRDIMLNAPRFQSSGAGDALRQNGKSQLYVKGNTADWLQNEALRKSGQAAYNDALLKGNLQDAQEYMQYRAGLDEFNNSEIQRHGEFANQVDNLRMQQSAADAQMKSNIEAIKSDIFNKAWYANTQYLDQMAREKAGITAKRDLQPIYDAINAQYQGNVKAWQNKWGDNTDSAAAQAELEAIRANTLRQKQLYDMQFENRRLPSGFRVNLAAKGGKVGKDSKITYSRDPYPELLIQNDKNTAQYVERLSEAVLKMILQTKPIHVS